MSKKAKKISKGSKVRCIGCGGKLELGVLRCKRCGRPITSQAAKAAAAGAMRSPAFLAKSAGVRPDWWHCWAGHPNPPAYAHCTACGEPWNATRAQREAMAVEGARAHLGDRFYEEGDPAIRLHRLYTSPGFPSGGAA